MKSFSVLAGSFVLLCACSTPPQTPEQIAAAAAEKENCPEVTGSRLRRCGPNAMRDAGVKTMDAATARSAMGNASTGAGREAAGGR